MFILSSPFRQFLLASYSKKWGRKEKDFKPKSTSSHWSYGWISAKTVEICTKEKIPPAITTQNDYHQIRENESELSDESSENESEIDVEQYAITEAYTPYDVHVQCVTWVDRPRENVGDAQQSDDTDNIFAEHQQPLAEERKESDAVNALSEKESEALKDENEENQERDLRKSTITRKQLAWFRSDENVNTIYF